MTALAADDRFVDLRNHTQAMPFAGWIKPSPKPANRKENEGPLEMMATETFMHALFGPVASVLTASKELSGGDVTGPAPKAADIDAGAQANVAHATVAALPMTREKFRPS